MGWEEPVGVKEIAERLDVQPNTVHVWRHRRVLPEPKGSVSGDPVWDWPDIEAWAEETGRLG